MAIRVVAAILGAIATFWGVILALIFNSEGDPERWVMFLATAGPGYVVTAGYLIRAVSLPSLEMRLAIWTASLTVQGIWLVWGCWEFQFSFMHLWWLSATLCSLWAIFAELNLENRRIEREFAECTVTETHGISH